MVRYTLNIPKDLHKKAKAMAKAQDSNLASVIRRSLKKLVEEYCGKLIKSNPKKTVYDATKPLKPEYLTHE